MLDWSCGFCFGMLTQIKELYFISLVDCGGYVIRYGVFKQVVSFCLTLFLSQSPIANFSGVCLIHYKIISSFHHKIISVKFLYSGKRFGHLEWGTLPSWNDVIGSFYWLWLLHPGAEQFLVSSITKCVLYHGYF